MGEIKKEVLAVVFFLFVILITSSIVSAGFFDWLKKITGYASTEQTVSINITVGVPQIINVYNNTIPGAPSIQLNEAKSTTNITKINFTVYLATGASNLNYSTVVLNLSKNDEATRNASFNAGCWEIVSLGSYANFSCNISMWWWDSSGTWNITAQIKDNNSNVAQNTSTNIYITTTTGFVMGPSALTWGGIGAGAINQSSNNDPLELNNTGNVAITAGNVQVNATHLRGETDPTKALWAGNFSAGWLTGNSQECNITGTPGSTQMVYTTFTGIQTANLSRGNFTINNKGTGQEELYFCLRYAGTELTTQSYSTWNETAWTIKIV